MLNGIFVFIVVLVHGVIVFGAAALLRFDVTMAAVASQANIGGSLHVLAFAQTCVQLGQMISVSTARSVKLRSTVVIRQERPQVYFQARLYHVLLTLPLPWSCVWLE